MRSSLFACLLIALGLLAADSPAALGAPSRGRAPSIQDAQSFIQNCDPQFWGEGSSSRFELIADPVLVPSRPHTTRAVALRDIQQRGLRPGTCRELAAYKASLRQPVGAPVLGLDLPVTLRLAGWTTRYPAAAIIPMNNGNVIMIVDAENTEWGPGVVFLAFPLRTT